MVVVVVVPSLCDAQTQTAKKTKKTASPENRTENVCVCVFVC